MSALSSLLVRDDVVSIQRIEDALQRQVLEGGDIDTALLELNAAPENVINSYRAAIFGVPAASRQHVMGQEPSTLLAVPREVAERYRVVPLWIDQNVLVIAVATPPSERVMDELHDALHMRLAIRIATEMRIEAALAAHFGIVIPGRLRQLAEHVEKLHPGMLRPVAPLRSSTLPPPPHAGTSQFPAPFLGSGTLAQGSMAPTPSSAIDASSSVATLRSRSIGGPLPEPSSPAPRERRPAAVLGTTPGGFFEPNTARLSPVDAAAQGQAMQEPALRDDWRKRTLPSGSLAGPAAPTTRVSSVPPPSAPTPVSPTRDADREPTQRVSLHSNQPASAPPPSAPVPAPRRRTRSVASLRGPLTREKADKLLDKADDRNAIIEVFFAFARQYFDCAAMFAVREDRAVGVESYGLSGIGDVRAISVPLERTGTLDEVTRTLLPKTADLSRRPADRRLASVLGRLSAQPAAVVPICLRQRVVLFLYGDRSGEAFELEALAELIEFVPAVSRAFERVIRASKLLAAGALTAMREEEEAAAAARLPPPEPIPVLERGAPADFGRAPTIAAVVPPALAAAAHHDPHTIRAVIPPAADPLTRDALSTLGLGRQAPPPPSPEAARAAAISETDIETRATQQLRIPSPLPSPHTAAQTPTQGGSLASGHPSDTYTLLSGKPADARSSYSLHDAVSDVLQPTRSEAAPKPKRNVDQVAKQSDRPKPRSNPPVTSARPPADDKRRQPPKVDTVRPHADARSEGGQTVWTTEVVKLPARRSSAPPPGEHAHKRSDPPAHVSDPAPAQRGASDSGMELDGLLRDLCSSGPDDEAPFVAALVRLGQSALPALVQRFPGPLWFDRTEPFQRLPPGRDISAVARALHAFGQHALPSLMELLAAPNADLRFYALLLAADVHAEGLVTGLVPLLSDPDAQVKDLARTLLLRLRTLPGFRHVLEDLRGAVALDQFAAEVRIDAIQILGSLRDAASIDVLVLAMSAADHRVANAAHEALRTLTGQDCGTAPRKWQAWFAEHGKKDRVEWLIDGLMHADEAVRTIAGNELQRATQQYLGFHPGSPKKERERVQAKYRTWWQTKKG